MYNVYIYIYMCVCVCAWKFLHAYVSHLSRRAGRAAFGNFLKAPPVPGFAWDGEAKPAPKSTWRISGLNIYNHPEVDRIWGYIRKMLQFFQRSYCQLGFIDGHI